MASSNEAMVQLKASDGFTLGAFELALRHVEGEVVEGPRDRRRIALLVLFEVEQDLLGAGVSEDAFEHGESP